jgi:molybdopterin converting factor small subunit
MPLYHVRYLPAGQQPGRLTTLSVSLLEPATVGSLLAHLARAGSLVLPPGGGETPAESPDHLLILVNGRSLHSLCGPDTLLANGDTISILTPVAGG